MLLIKCLTATELRKLRRVSVSYVGEQANGNGNPKSAKWKIAYLERHVGHLIR